MPHGIFLPPYPQAYSDRKCSVIRWCSALLLLSNSTTGFLAVCAVSIFTVCRSFEYFGEVVTYLFLFHIESTKTFDARSVDNVSVSRYREHFGESGGVHSLVVISWYFRSLDFQPRNKGIDKGRLAYSRMSGEEGYPTFNSSRMVSTPSPVSADILKQG